MFGPRSNPLEEMLDFHNTFDRFFNQFWTDLPSRTRSLGASDIHVTSTEDAWKVSVPMPGVDPRHVTLDLAANRISIRVDQPETKDVAFIRFEQTITVPGIVETEHIKAVYRHGVLELTLPWKESVKPRRIEIEHAGDEQKQLFAAAS